MGTALAQLLPVALGFALSPIPLVEMVLILFSRRALANGIVFLACIIVPVFLIPFAGATGQDTAATTTSQRSTTQGIVLLIVAAVLLGIAWLNFRARHSQSVPKIFGKIQGMGPWAVVLLSAGVTIANPKNLVVLLESRLHRRQARTVRRAARAHPRRIHPYRHRAVPGDGRVPRPRRDRRGAEPGAVAAVAAAQQPPHHGRGARHTRPRPRRSGSQRLVGRGFLGYPAGPRPCDPEPVVTSRGGLFRRVACGRVRWCWRAAGCRRRRMRTTSRASRPRRSLGELAS